MDRQEWLNWRLKGIGSSDATIIMGVSPWKTPLKLFEEKLQTVAIEDNSNEYIKRKGNEMESKIRAMFEAQNMFESYPAKLVESTTWPFMRASLDGCRSDGQVIIEIKLVGKDDFNEMTKTLTVVEKYFPQVQHQLAVTGAPLCVFIAYCDRENDKVMREANLLQLRVHPVPEYIGNLIAAEQAFWDCVQKKKPPVASDGDYKSIKGMSKVVNKYRRLSQKIKAMEAELDVEKEKILDAAKEMNHPRIVCSGLKLLQVSRIGNVDYKKIPELANVDLEKYRGKGSVYWKIEI